MKTDKKIKKPMSKAASEFRHAQKRAKERYGLALDKNHYLKLCDDVKNERGEYLGRQSNRLTVWRIEIDSVSANVIYDKKRHRIVTFLPHDIKDVKGIKLEAVK